MDRQKLIVQTKLTPPRLQKHTLHRARLTLALQEAESQRLSLVQAGTGYGKSTALAAFAREVKPVAWYHLAAEDTESSLFLLHLIHAFRFYWPALSEAPLALLEEWEQNPGGSLWTQIVDALVSALSAQITSPAFLVLDDVHLLNKSTQTLRILDRFIGRAPALLHIILSTRYPLELPSLITWRVRGQVGEIDQRDLAFTQEEITTLFSEQYGLELNQEQVSVLAERIEGWPIALPLVRQRLLRNDKLSLSQALGQVAGSTGELFAFLAQEVLEQQPADIQTFLRDTSVLRQLTPAICDALCQADDSADILRYLLENGLFIVDLGNGYSRYHNLFRDLLLNRLPVDFIRQAHLRAAANCQQRGDVEEGIFHFLSAGADEEAAGLLVELGQQLIRAGRLDTLEGWIGSLAPDILAGHPALLVYLGDVARLRSRFDKALEWYEQAEERSRIRGDNPGVGQALRGQARVYLDTVNPSKAERLLQEALQLSDGQPDRESQARLLILLAENMLNQGRFKEAERYQAEARQLREEGPGEAEIPVRLLLRSGKLDQARRLLEKQVEAERREPVLRPRAHRETLLLLSLVLAFQGEREPAYQAAVEGTERGRALNSPFITAVGYMRQGHAWLLSKDEAGYDRARRCFLEAIRLSETLDVPRLKVEANWGLVQAFGFAGDLEMARSAGELGIAIAQAAGDQWIVGSIDLVLGASHTLAGLYQGAAEWLTRASLSFRDCGDTYGEVVSRLWLNHLWWLSRDETRLQRDVGDLLQQVQRHQYGYLFQRKTLLGPPDPRALVPLLLFARQTGQNRAFAEQLLGQLGLAGLEIHPGYQLRVQALGRFTVWRGDVTIGRKEWERKKALHLFQLLLTQRGRMLEREQITETLWPELDPEVAQRDFKIAYSTLNRVLDPARDRNTPAAFLIRDDTLYGLRPETDIWLDIDEVDRFVTLGDGLFEADVEAALPYYRQALALYQGEYLQELPYAEWCTEERERLQALILRTAERLARTLVAKGNWEEAIEVCQTILSLDDCWEQAYRLMMTAFDRLGNRVQALRTYQRCQERLQSELGVRPSPATVELHLAIQKEASQDQKDQPKPL